MYILKRSDGAYVADITKSNGASYTNKLQHARVFATREAAEKDRCPGNEYVVTLAEEMGAS